jgi:hypothetical protein
MSLRAVEREPRGTPRGDQYVGHGASYSHLLCALVALDPLQEQPLVWVDVDHRHYLGVRQLGLKDQPIPVGGLGLPVGNVGLIGGAWRYVERQADVAADVPIAPGQRMRRYGETSLQYLISSRVDPQLAFKPQQLPGPLVGIQGVHHDGGYVEVEPGLRLRPDGSAENDPHG